MSSLLLRKSKPVLHPGLRGSTHWYRDDQGQVVYGDRPAERYSGPVQHDGRITFQRPDMKAPLPARVTAVGLDGVQAEDNLGQQHVVRHAHILSHVGPPPAHGPLLAPALGAPGTDAPPPPVIHKDGMGALDLTHPSVQDHLLGARFAREDQHKLEEHQQEAARAERDLSQALDDAYVEVGEGQAPPVALATFLEQARSGDLLRRPSTATAAALLDSDDLTERLPETVRQGLAGPLLEWAKTERSLVNCHIAMVKTVAGYWPVQGDHLWVQAPGEHKPLLARVLTSDRFGHAGRVVVRPVVDPQAAPFLADANQIMGHAGQEDLDRAGLLGKAMPHDPAHVAAYHEEAMAALRAAGVVQVGLRPDPAEETVALPDLPRWHAAQAGALRDHLTVLQGALGVRQVGQGRLTIKVSGLPRSMLARALYFSGDIRMEVSPHHHESVFHEFGHLLAHAATGFLPADAGFGLPDGTVQGHPFGASPGTPVRYSDPGAPEGHAVGRLLQAPQAADGYQSVTLRTGRGDKRTVPTRSVQTVATARQQPLHAFVAHLQQQLPAMLFQERVRRLRRGPDEPFGPAYYAAPPEVFARWFDAWVGWRARQDGVRDPRFAEPTNQEHWSDQDMHRLDGQFRRVVRTMPLVKSLLLPLLAGLLRKTKESPRA
jgi:hypothetical protein